MKSRLGLGCLLLGSLCTGWIAMGCPGRSQVREDAPSSAHKPTVALVLQWKTRDPRWQSFLRGAANEVLLREGYDVLSGSSGTSYSPERAALMKSIGMKPIAMTQSAPIDGAELVIKVAAWTDARGADVRGAASVKFLETPSGRLLGSATAFGEPYAQGQGSDLQSTKEAVQRAIVQVSRQFFARQRQDVQAGGVPYEVHIVKRGKLADFDDQIVVKLRRSGHFVKVRHITSGDHRIMLRCRSKYDVAAVRQHLRQVLQGMPAVRSVRTPTSWRRVVVVLLNHPSK